MLEIETRVAASLRDISSTIQYSGSLSIVNKKYWYYKERWILTTHSWETSDIVVTKSLETNNNMTVLHLCQYPAVSLLSLGEFTILKQKTTWQSRSLTLKPVAIPYTAVTEGKGTQPALSYNMRGISTDGWLDIRMTSGRMQYIYSSVTTLWKTLLYFILHYNYLTAFKSANKKLFFKKCQVQISSSSI